MGYQVGCGTPFSLRPSSHGCSTARWLRDTIVKGVCEGILAYVGKTASGDYDPFIFRKTVTLDDVELSDDVYIVTKETAEAYVKSKAKPPVVVPEPDTARHADQAGAADDARDTHRQDGADWRHGHHLSADCAKRHGGEIGVDRHGSRPEVDELLHQGAVEVRQRQGPNVDRHRGSGAPKAVFPARKSRKRRLRCGNWAWRMM